MSEDNNGDNDDNNSNNDDNTDIPEDDNAETGSIGSTDNGNNADWRQVSKGRRAVTHTDKRRVTPVRNQFQDLSEQHDASDTGSTPRLAPRELIAAFSQLPPEDNNNDDNAETGPIGSTYIPEDDYDDNTETGSFGSTESFDTMTDITNDYGSLIEIIRLVNAEFREVLGSALSTQPCSGRHGGYSWLVDNEEDYTHRVGATTPYTVQSMPKGPPMPTDPPKSASSSAYKRYTIDQQKYNEYLHWNTEALAALEHRFPNP
jgi:hypothetical protein